jgi:hypothetical protein
MIGLLSFALLILISPFKSGLRLAGKNAALQHQLMDAAGWPRNDGKFGCFKATTPAYAEAVNRTSRCQRSFFVCIET